MKKSKFNRTFWEQKYINRATGWDIGTISTPLQQYFDQLQNKNLAILIPGAGNAYEAEYLFKQGFTDVTVLDVAKQPLQNFKSRVRAFPPEKLIEDDFFAHSGTYNLIIEQTFFCALDPSLRTNYVHKMKELLTENGQLVGLFFDFPLTAAGPPFGGTQKEYRALFSPDFKIKVLEKAYNSIEERATKELFAIFEKR